MDCNAFVDDSELPTPTRMKDFEAILRTKPPGSFIRHNAAANTYVFTWTSSISATDHASKYYKDVSFECSFHVPRLNDEIWTKCKEHLSLDRLLINFELKMYFGVAFTMLCDSVTKHITEKGALQLPDWHTLEEQSLAQLNKFSVEPIENQISDFLARNMETCFPEFIISREAQKTHNNEVSYSPFFNSRRDITVTRNISTFGYIHVIDGVTVEAKKSVSEKSDQYQLLAGMEITAAKIARQKLGQGHLKEILVNGALVDFKANNGTLYLLKMDFDTGESKVQKVEQNFTVAEVLAYLLSSI